MVQEQSIESVVVVDKLMTQFRHGVKPSDADIVKAYELGINVKALKQYVEETEMDVLDEYADY